MQHFFVLFSKLKMDYYLSIYQNMSIIVDTQPQLLINKKEFQIVIIKRYEDTK